MKFQDDISMPHTHTRISRNQYVPHFFKVWGIKMITVDFSETIAASDLKGCRNRHIIEYMKIISIEGQGHFLTLAQGCVHTKIQTEFSQKLLYRFEPNFVRKLSGTMK